MRAPRIRKEGIEQLWESQLISRAAFPHACAGREDVSLKLNHSRKPSIERFFFFSETIVAQFDNPGAADM